MREHFFNCDRSINNLFTPDLQIIEENGEPKFDPTGYDKDLVEALERDIVQKNPNVHWWVYTV